MGSTVYEPVSKANDVEASHRFSLRFQGAQNVLKRFSFTLGIHGRHNGFGR